MVTQNIYRTHSCGELCKEHIGQSIKLSGWVHHRRDHGGVLFIDLRDHYGITQIVFHPENETMQNLASHLSYESVITICGTVVARTEETVNTKLSTGEIEVEVSDLVIESRSKTLPFQVAESKISNEEMRLRYRFLDLRRAKMQKNIILRAKIIKSIREHLENKGFHEFQTPILANSSPEGARDYLVPSRVHPGQFYALPQAPQQYKQLLMMSGFDKYFQIAPCFRDEDARADRSPGEFYQLDLEMAFVTQEEIFKVIDDLMKELVNSFGNFKLKDQNFPLIPYLEAMNKYGTDKPDIRYDLHLADLTEDLKDSDCQIFSQGKKKGVAIKAICYPGGAAASRKFFDGLQDWAKNNGLKGLAYIVFEEDGVKGPIVKFLSEAELEIIKNTTGAKVGDVVFFAVAKWKAACEGLGALRRDLAARMEIADPNEMAFCWIVDFPMYEKDEQTGEIIFSHNPFSMPQGGMQALKEKNPLDILAWQYDICCNGIELSSGAIRNHKTEIMYKAFEISGHTKADVDKHFGHMIKAFEYGAPPHGGVAPGIDRLVMLFANEQNIREVIAFPKNQKAQDLMVGAPGPVFPEQLAELNIRIIEED